MAESWKFFLIEITYRVPAEALGDAVPEHRAFLQTGYDRGWLLLSGPQSPRIGGVIIARGPSRAEIEQFFQDDPYKVRGLADHRIVEFDPVKRAAFLEDWVSGRQ